MPSQPVRKGMFADRFNEAAGADPADAEKRHRAEKLAVELQ